MTLTDTELEALLAERKKILAHVPLMPAHGLWTTEQALIAAVPDLLRRVREAEAAIERDNLRRDGIDPEALSDDALLSRGDIDEMCEQVERLRGDRAGVRRVDLQVYEMVCSRSEWVAMVLNLRRLLAERDAARKELADALTRANRAEADAAACRIDAVSTDDDRVETLLEELAKARAELARLRAGTNP